MKFGKRGDSEGAAPAGGTSGDPSASDPAQPLPPVPESPPPIAEHDVPAVPVAEHETPGSPAGEQLPVAHVEPVVEGEAYEVFADEPPEALTVEQHDPAPAPAPAPAPEPEPAPAAAPVPFPAAEQPVSVAGAAPGPAPVTTLGNSGEAFASGHSAAPGPSWQEPVMELANERPELAVAAAFAGGVLAAMILRRLGS